MTIFFSDRPLARALVTFSASPGDGSVCIILSGRIYPIDCAFDDGSAWLAMGNGGVVTALPGEWEYVDDSNEANHAA